MGSKRRTEPHDSLGTQGGRDVASIAKRITDGVLWRFRSGSRQARRGSIFRQQTLAFNETIGKFRKIHQSSASAVKSLTR